MKNIWIMLLFVPLFGFAAEITINITDNEGKPVEDAVVLINSVDSDMPHSITKRAFMKQEGKLFVPHVLPVRVGTEIEFPNLDDVKHHVYSFSDAKTFELELYDKFEGQPLVFDKTGIVELGCNIHDWMLAYIYVTDADLFFTTAEQGSISTSLTNGNYTIKLWHPLAQEEDTQKTYQLLVTGNKSLSFSFEEDLEEELDFSTGFDDY